VNLSFVDSDSAITSLRAIKAGFSIWRGTHRVATAPAAVVAVLGIRVGTAWSDTLRSEVERATRVERVKAAALRLLRASERSKAALADRLAAKGFDAADVRDAISDLERAGLVDDARAARAIADRASRRHQAAKAIDSTLAARGFAPADRDDAVSATGAKSDAAAARDALKTELARLHTLAPAAAARRAFAFLARRGFDESIAEDVVRTLFKIDE